MVINVTPCRIPFCDDEERIEELKRVFREALSTVEDASELGNHMNTNSLFVRHALVHDRHSHSELLHVPGGQKQVRGEHHPRGARAEVGYT